MSEWKKVKLGELYEVHNGLSKGRQFFGTGFPFLTFSNVFNNWFLPKQLDSLVQTTDKEREACSIKAGDVFITRTSETMDELGMSSVALKDYPNATYNGFTKRLRPITDRVNPRYIGYYLRTPKFRGQFMAFSTMTTRASLANNDLLNMEVELPPMETQLRIASILSRYDSLIENYQKQIKLLEEAAQRLYKEWFLYLAAKLLGLAFVLLDNALNEIAERGGLLCKIIGGLFKQLVQIVHNVLALVDLHLGGDYGALDVDIRVRADVFGISISLVLLRFEVFVGLLANAFRFLVGAGEYVVRPYRRLADLLLRFGKHPGLLFIRLALDAVGGLIRLGYRAKHHALLIFKALHFRLKLADALFHKGVFRFALRQKELKLLLLLTEHGKPPE